MLARRYLISVFLFVICFNTYSQINKNGISFIKNYTKDDYDASEQNWAVCQDNRGVMYFGNNDEGVIVFNGNTWEKIKVNNNEVRALAVDTLGNVFVGGNNEFGYLSPDLNGKLKYISLSNQVNDTVSFKQVWKIYTHGTTVYFCTFNHVFIFKDKNYVKTIHEKEGAFWSFLIHNNLYWGNYYDGLKVLDGDSLILAKGGSFFKEKDIFVILPFSENQLFIGTMVQGCYLYNPQTGEVKDIAQINNSFANLSKLLKEGQLYNGIVLNDGKIAYGTINNGCYIADKNGNVIEQYSKNEGVLDNSVTSIFQDRDGGLWFSLIFGISYIEYQSPFREFNSSYGFDGLITCVKVFKGNLFIGTTLGLYQLKYNKNQLPYFELVKDIDHFVWEMEIVKINNKTEKLIIGTGRNTYELIKLQTAIPINESKYTNASYIYQSKVNKKRIYIGSENGINYIENIDGHWKSFEKLSDIKEKVTSIAEDHEGNIWVSTEVNGLLKISENTPPVRYDLASGLPSLPGIKVYNIKDEIFVATLKGLYTYNPEKDIFVKYDGFGEKYKISNDQVVKIVIGNENEYWVILKNNITNHEYLEKVNITEGRIVNVTEIPFKRLLKKTLSNVDPNPVEGTWISGSDAVYFYNENINVDNYANYFNSLINKVKIGIDSVIFWGTNYTDTTNKIIALDQPRELKEIVNYKNNSFQFFYSSPFYPTDELKYSSILQGFDEEWTNWDIKTERGFTNLNQGHYTFKVKAKNIYGIESDIASYEFTIRPPWYETLLAYFCYLILAVVIIIVIVKIYTRRLELEKIRLEQIVKERTEEVVKQKEEIEKQRDEIAEKNKSITDSIEYAKRIQTAVLPSNDFAKEVLPEHFILFRPRDIVSGDFYWFTKKDNLLVIIAADCTGHGVPGAFMSMLGVSFLNEIVNRHDVSTAGAILTQLRADVKKTLGQEGKEGEAKDGMDIALCIVDLENMKMQYAGAYNPLYICRNNELIEVKADRMPIGIYIKEKESFTNNEIDLEKGDTFYLFSDGYSDQFGGEDGQKFKSKNFKELLLEIYHKPMAEQREILNTKIDKWRGRWEQVDDIIILGIRV